MEFVKNPGIIVIVTGTCGVWLQVRTGLNASVNSFKPERSAVRGAETLRHRGESGGTEAEEVAGGSGNSVPFCSWTPHLRRVSGWV